MSTVKTTNIQHPDAASPAIVLDASGSATVTGGAGLQDVFLLMGA